MFANPSEIAGKKKEHKQVIRSEQPVMYTFGQGWNIMNGKSVNLLSKFQTTMTASFKRNQVSGY